jgi:antigen 43
MATFTWTATTSAGPFAWETPTDWFSSSGTLASSSFTQPPGNDYLIGSSNFLTINNIGAGGTGSPDIANSLTLSDVNGSLLLADTVGNPAGALDVTTTLSLAHLLNLGTNVGGGVLSMGGTAGGGIINLGTGLGGRLEGALGDKVVDVGTSPTEITGAGIVIAQNGLFQFGTSVQVASGDTTKFEINPTGTLAFADAVSGGTIVFTVNSGGGVLDVGALSTFDAPVSGMSVYTGGSVAAGQAPVTSYIDFLNAGTAATATLTNITTAGATLTVFANSGSQAIPIVGNYVGKFINYEADVGGSGTNVYIANTPCYAAGTAIEVPGGQAAVETIRPGDLVMTSTGGIAVPRRVIWVGEREIDLSHYQTPEPVAPVRFRRGALGHDLPRRDLVLSPDHCLFIDGALFPAKLLVNGMTIIRDLSVRKVTYHHIELERHGVLIAEGVEAESYLDTGNRAYFSNAGLATILHPEFHINEHLRCWETDACAPLAVRPEVVRPVWDRFATLAAAMGFAAPRYATTTDAGVCLMVDGKIVRPLGERNRTFTFLVPEAAGSVRLMSRSVKLGVLRPWLDDPRQLGVAVRSVALCDRSGETVFGADHPALTDGWHGVEYTRDGAPWRWSAGDAALPIVSDGPCVVQVTLSQTTTYLESPVNLAA